MPASNYATHSGFNLLQDSGQMGLPGGNAYSTGAFQFPGYFILDNGSSAAGLGKFINNNSDHGGSAGTLAPSVNDLITKIRDNGYRRYGAEFWVAEITHGSGTGSSYSSGGHTYYQSLLNAYAPRFPHLTFHAFIRAIDDAIYINRNMGLTQVDGTPVYSDCIVNPADGRVSLHIWDSVEPRQSNGYAPPFFSVYAKSVGNRWQCACPTLTPGRTQIDNNSGIVPAYGQWSS